MKPPTATSVETPPTSKSAAAKELKGGRSPKPKANAAATGAASPSSSVKEKQDKKLKDNAVTQQLTKTKMCAFFERGKCASVNCRYAHSSDELRTAPNLQKTKLCRSFLQGGCNDENCPFAHGDGDLRVTEGIYKTQICNFFERGYCKKGDRCNHAHGSVDLRPTAATPVATTPLSKSSPNSNTGGGSESAKPRRSPLPLAELLIDSEGNFNTSTPAPAVPPTPTKSVTELASLAFSPMPSSPLWGYGMRQMSPASALGSVGKTLGSAGTSDPLVRAMWPRDPVDVLVDQHARSPQAQQNSLLYGIESVDRPFEPLGGSLSPLDHWLSPTDQRTSPALMEAASPSSVLSPPPLAPPSLVAPATPAPPAAPAITTPTPPPPTPPPPPPPPASTRAVATEPPVERPLEPDLAMVDLSERLASLDGVMNDLSKDIADFRSSDRIHRI